MNCNSPPSRSAFSLIELVVVVMVLGILAAIAAPRLFGMTDAAVENGLEHTLSVIRTAIDSFAAEHGGTLPGADGDEHTFVDDMNPYLRGAEFPTCPVGAKNNRVRMLGGMGSILPGIPTTRATYSWVYKYDTGDFHVNNDKMSSDGLRSFDRF
jgi:general secretion pathway protein G